MSTPIKRVCRQASRIRPQQWRTISTTAPQHADALSETDADLEQLLRQPGVKYTMTEEPDRDLGKYKPEGLSSLAHRELEQHRELREMVRLAAWEMPLLSSLSKPFQTPRDAQVLRWRYTTYMGEAHPAARKVVVTFNPFALPDTTYQQVQKLLKLAGARYNPTRREVRMSCEGFETPAQNKRYLADTVNALVAEAKDPAADGFEDVPLDLRHHTPPIRHKFPRRWAMTPQRRLELETTRRAVLEGEGKRVEGNTIVSGTQAIEEARRAEVEQEKEPVMEQAGMPLPAGKMGKREKGQSRVQRP